MTDNVRRLLQPGSVDETLQYTMDTPGVRAVVVIVQGEDESWTPYWSRTTLSNLTFALRVAEIKLDRIMRGEDDEWLVGAK